ncbi:hypothetical protein C1A_716 [Wolbachia endosymbiont of Culex quinquefasciatus JHB]|nr:MULTISPECIES: hypothetical protein [Wolbachia]EEB56534.1 hypothetical protein C1A_716 [Wolbachia endosymbiont of Culex quinquefasciatus JHB]UXX39716.1 hypothetical protein MJ631_04200 [Wolbachia endosymbiont of Oryzaephilus surinamensis]CAQ55269.1 hypothetical protein WP1161 [Wolbachia endosymbiont of Culex quinquefasciatus Pel]CQD05962.1 Uncharacterised protein [Wolbachia endosymbiont wPip_Mol of Culex molestus]BDG75818.1 hypothetical protein wHmt_03760 [Wolbachia pipientis]
MPNNTDQSKKINEKWLFIGGASLFLVIMLPSIFLLAKIAMMFVIISTTAIAIKIASKAISNVLEDKENQSTQNKIINLAIGAVSILAGGLSLLITAKVGFIAICSTIAILALYEYIKDEKIGKDINDKFDEIANNTTEFCVNSIEKLIPSQSCEV